MLKGILAAVVLLAALSIAYSSLVVLPGDTVDLTIIPGDEEYVVVRILNDGRYELESAGGKRFTALADHCSKW